MMVRFSHNSQRFLVVSYFDQTNTNANAGQGRKNGFVQSYFFSAVWS